MPVYTYRCRQCGTKVEAITPYGRRDSIIRHDGPDSSGEECQGILKRDPGLERPHIGSGCYEMKAILGNGAKLTGHFGKEAKRRKKKQ